MPSYGPQPPSQSEKRKYDENESSDEDSYGPNIPTGPQTRKSSSPEPAPKRNRVIGPSLPPANLDERPPQPPSDQDDSSDEDDFGPALPSAHDRDTSRQEHTQASQVSTEPPPSIPKSTRDEWMIVPPSSGDWTSRVDPTKLKNRTFNTGKSAKGASQSMGGDSAKWTETPSEKRARLEREMLGITGDAKSNSKPQQPTRSEESARRVREYAAKSRGEALVAEHQRLHPEEKEDDPSARAFDREKDIAGGMKIGQAQRKELMKKAADFGSRFSSAKYL